MGMGKTSGTGDTIMATTRGGIASASAMRPADEKQAGAMWKSHSLRHGIGTRRSKGRCQRGGEVETLRQAWGWRTCDRCGETLVLGEEVLRVPVGESTKEMCLDCAGIWGSTTGLASRTAAAWAASEGDANG
jgi:hypothetical protein